MNIGDRPIKTVVVYTPYQWEHVLVSIRISRPLHEAGMQILQGNKLMEIHPEYVDQADAVLIQREFPENLEIYQEILKLARDKKKPVIYEIDDLLFDLPDSHLDSSSHYYTPALFAMLRAVIEADLVTTSSVALRDYLLAFNENTTILANYLDDELWRLPALNQPQRQVEKTGSTIIVGYMGTNTHHPDLQMITPLLMRLLDRYGDLLSLRFWSAEPPDVLRSRPQVEWNSFKTNSYAEFAAYFCKQTCDIFVAPLLDNTFNRCKSAIKFLEYSALGIPGVYSRIGPYETVVQDGQNGFLAGSEAEWEKCLVELIESSELRAKLGQNAFQTVSRDWRLSDHAGEWTAAYEQAWHSAQDVAATTKRQPYLATYIAIANQVRGWQNKMYDQLIQRDQLIQSLQTQLAEQENQNISLQERYAAQDSFIKSNIGSRVWRWLQAARRIKQRLLGQVNDQT